MHEAMAIYQTLYGLKPIGAHRRMAHELFNDVKIRCEACGGQASATKIDWDALPNLSAEDLRDLGVVLGSHRRRVLDAFPGVAADPIPEFATAPLAYDLSHGRIVDLFNPECQARSESRREGLMILGRTSLPLTSLPRSNFLIKSLKHIGAR
jgi:hypothetical protein